MILFRSSTHVDDPGRREYHPVLAGAITCRAFTPRFFLPRRAWLALFFLMAPACSLTAVAQSGTARTVEDRYNLIPVFLYNFLMFTEWPNDDVKQPMIIGVLGENLFGRAADAIAQKKVDDRAVQFRFFATPEHIEPTHVLFLPLDHDEWAPDICRRLKGTAVLTVGEGERFTRQGGVIRFFESRTGSGSESSLGVEINETAANAAGLRFRSKLKRLAQLVSYPLPNAP